MLLVVILLRWALLAAAIAITASLVPDVDVSGGVWGLLGVAAVYALVNAVIGPILHLLSLPLTLVTFGLFALVVNGALLALTAGLSSNLDVGGFLQSILAALIITVLSLIAQFLVVSRQPHRSTQPAS